MWRGGVGESRLSLRPVEGGITTEERDTRAAGNQGFTDDLILNWFLPKTLTTFAVRVSQGILQRSSCALGLANHRRAGSKN